MGNAMKEQKSAVSWLLVILLSASSCGSLRHFRADDSFERGLALFNQGHFEEAIPHFKRATEQEPEFAEAYFYLGRSHLSARHWREAIQPLRAAYRLAPEAAKQEIFDVLMDAFLAAGLPPEGVRSPSERFKNPL
jgi:tetratricopeptide (TPR) repeat protein